MGLLVGDYERKTSSNPPIFIVLAVKSSLKSIDGERSDSEEYRRLGRRLEKDIPSGRMHLVETCSLPISIYFSALKILWLSESIDAVKEAVKNSDAFFDTINTWLILNLSGASVRRLETITKFMACV
ncbi:Glycerol kinase [Acorus calamus]|uniref:Glycerol kinase n=1 Tax=Acorus calamus TaxID=4465 RepID=A0AAV9F0J1_ACOCL|nr:Glycerol kinase [Acorus calamus]